MIGRHKETLASIYRLPGEWWLVDRPGTRLFGTLSYEGGGGIISLELCGTFWPDESAPRNIRLIQGLFQDSREVTLRDAGLLEEWTAHGRDGRRVKRTRLYVNEVIIGLHYDHEEDIRFNALRLHLTDLEEWTSEWPIGWNHSTNHQTEGATYRHPEGRTIAIPSRNIAIGLEYALMQTYGGRSLAWTMEAWFRISGHNLMHRDELVEVAESLGQLLTLLIGRAVYPVALAGITDKFVQVIGDPPRETDIPHEVSLLGAYQDPRERGELDGYKILVPKNVIENELDTVLNLWFEKRDALGPTIDLLTAAIFRRGRIAPEVSFLMLTQALEAFHRRVVGGTYVGEKTSKDVRRALEHAIPEDLPDAFKQAVREKLKWLNEYSLRMRLKELVGMVDQEGRRFLRGTEETLISSVVDTRNYLNHYSEKLRKKAVGELDLVPVNVKLRLLATMLVLREIGVPMETVAERVPRDYEYDIIAR